MIFVSQSGVRRENSEKLEFDDPLNENAMFLRSQELRNEDKMIPKPAKKRKKSSEEAKREQRSAKRFSRAYKGERKVRSKTLWGDILRCLGTLGEHFGTLLDEFLRF